MSEAATPADSVSAQPAAVRARTFRSELWRKSIHLCSALIPGVYWVVGDRWLMLLMLGVALLLIGIGEALRTYVPSCRRLFEELFGFMLRRDEHVRLTGATYVMLAALLTVALFPTPAIAIASLLILSVSDSLAAIVGVGLGGPRLAGKTIGGSSAFFLSALAILAALLHPTLALPVLALVALIVTLVEAAPLDFGWFHVNDNLSIPLSAGVAIECAWLLTV